MSLNCFWLSCCCFSCCCRSRKLFFAGIVGWEFKVLLIVLCWWLYFSVIISFWVYLLFCSCSFALFYRNWIVFVKVIYFSKTFFPRTLPQFASSFLFVDKGSAFDVPKSWQFLNRSILKYFRNVLQDYNRYWWHSRFSIRIWGRGCWSWRRGNFPLCGGIGMC